MTVSQGFTATWERFALGKSLYAGLGEKPLAALRIYLMGYWFVEVTRSTLPRLAEFHPGWYAPHGVWLLVPSSFFDWVFSAIALNFMKWATATSVAWMLLGLPGRRCVGYANLLLLLIFTSFLRGFGHPDHSHVQILLVTVVLHFSPAWDVWTISKSGQSLGNTGAVTPVYAQSFAAMALIFSVPYFATAIYRLAKEGLSIFFGTSMQYFLARDSLVLDDFTYTAGLWIVEHPALLPLINFSFFLVTAAELAAPFAHLKRGYCAAFLLVILPFHVLSPLLMHIMFFQNIIVIIGLYLGPFLIQSFGLRDDSRM